MFKSVSSISAVLLVTLFFVFCISINIVSSNAREYNEAVALASKKVPTPSKTTKTYIDNFIKTHIQKEKTYKERMNKAVKISVTTNKKVKFNRRREIERLQKKEKRAIRYIKESEEANKFHDKQIDLYYIYQWLSRLQVRLTKLKESHRLIVIKKKRVFHQSQKETLLLKQKTASYKKTMLKYKSLMQTSTKKYKTIRAKYIKAKNAYHSSLTVYLKLVKQQRIAMEQYQQAVSILKKKITKITIISKKIIRLRRKIQWIIKYKETLHKKTVIKTKIVHMHHYYFGINNPLMKGKCLCPVVFKPVCGADGVSYSSPCVARCAGAKVASVGQCKCIPNAVDLPPVQAPPTTEKSPPKETTPKSPAPELK